MANVDPEDVRDGGYHKLESVYRVPFYRRASEETSGGTKSANPHEIRVQNGVAEEYESVVVDDNCSLLEIVELYLVQVNIYVDHSHLEAALRIYLALQVGVSVGDRVREV